MIFCDTITAMRTVITMLLIFSITTPINLFAQTPSIEELQNKIKDNQSKVKQIEEEIRKYEKELKQVQGEKMTLQNAIYELDISRKKTNAQILLTENKIKKTKENILSLTEQINLKLLQIERNSKGLAQALRKIHEADNETLIEIFLKHESLADAWITMESLRRFQEIVTQKVNELKDIKNQLEEAKNEKEKEKRILGAEKEELASNKKSLDITRQTKSRLLKSTKNKESEYQKILSAKRKAKEEFEAQMAKFEAQLKFVLDKKSIPEKGSKIFTWPVPNRYITQYFGNTKFARSGAYNGRGHNGIDIRASIGTRVNAVLDGVVKDTNEKVSRYCQYGKWVLIDHKNGLTTLYAHLSEISVKKGQNVTTGQRIGYSGNTGYATGPHLHLTTYASKALQFKQYKCKTTGIVVKVPISAYEGYLNPLDYF